MSGIRKTPINPVFKGRTYPLPSEIIIYTLEHGGQHDLSMALDIADNLYWNGDNITTKLSSRSGRVVVQTLKTSLSRYDLAYL